MIDAVVFPARATSGNVSKPKVVAHADGVTELLLIESEAAVFKWK